MVKKRNKINYKEEWANGDMPPKIRWFTLVYPLPIKRGHEQKTMIGGFEWENHL
jgi:hypothetical protein